MKRISLLIIAILLVITKNYAQGSLELGFLPSFNLNKSLARDWSVIFKAESRQSIKKDDIEYEYLLTDISLGVSKKTGINSSVSLGYLIRIDDTLIKSRTFQQLSIVKRYSGFRVSHRLLTDQTFGGDQSSEFRLRYRISSEIPLQGQDPDPGEFFLKLGNEYLNSFQDKRYDLEIRGATFLGYVVSPASKLEFGFDYRINSFMDGKARNRLWLGFNFFISI